MRDLIQETRVQVASIPQTGSQGQASTSAGKSLLDPKSFTVKVFDGDKGDKEDFEEWRDDLEEQLDAFFPGVKAILTKGARSGIEITESNFKQYEEAVEKIFSVLDIDGSGSLGIDEFVHGPRRRWRNAPPLAASRFEPRGYTFTEWTRRPSRGRCAPKKGC